MKASHVNPHNMTYCKFDESTLLDFNRVKKQDASTLLTKRLLWHIKAKYAHRPNGIKLIPEQALKHKNKLTVVLDLDETLVRFREGPVHWRPGYDKFLDKLKEICEVVLWTASTDSRFDTVKQALDPNGDRIHYKVVRDPSWFIGRAYTKDLTQLGREMNRVLIIENTLQSVILNPQNAILVSDYIEPNPDDNELEILGEVIARAAANPETIIPEYLATRTDVLTQTKNNFGSFCAVRKHWAEPTLRLQQESF